MKEIIFRQIQFVFSGYGEDSEIKDYESILKEDFKSSGWTPVQNEKGEYFAVSDCGHLTLRPGIWRGLMTLPLDENQLDTKAFDKLSIAAARVMEDIGAVLDMHKRDVGAIPAD